MKNFTRAAFLAFASQIAILNSVPDVTTKFTVDPTIAQKLIDKQQESSEFLRMINIIQVPEAEAEVVGLGVSSLIARRTDTSGAGVRTTTDPSGLTSVKYKCSKTDYDTHLTYAKMDIWGKFKDFQTRISNQIAQAQALSRIAIGWNGTSVAATTNPAVNTKLEDVNKGWIAFLRDNKPSAIMSESVVGSGKVTYGPAGSYKNLDALVYDATENLLSSWAADDTDLVVLVGRSLVHDKYFDIVNQDDQSAVQAEAIGRIIRSDKKIGGLPPVRVPFFPPDKIMITKLSNISIYEQEGTRRRHIKDNPEKDRVEDYQSVNEAYVIEDCNYACVIENIEYKAA